MANKPGGTNDDQISRWKTYIDSPDRRGKLYKRTLFIVVLSQLFGGAGLAAGVTVGALLAQDMLGTDRYAGIPAALFTLGSAAASLLVGRLSQRFGRRLGLAVGFLAGALGAVGIIAAAVLHHVPLLFASLLVYGAGAASNMLTRYAGTDLAMPSQRATAVSLAMVSTTFGAVAGPNMVGVTGRFASSLSIPALAGPFTLAAAAFLLAGVFLFVFLRPDPFVVAKAISAAEETDRRATSDAPLHPYAAANRGIMVGAAVMILTQIVMAAIMTMTPVHMQHHGHDLGEVGFVIGVHIGAMFLPSLVTGVLVDRLGRTTMSYASGAVLLAAGILAASAPADSMLLLTLALALLGLGWNLGFISGTAIIVDATPPAVRAKTQGTVDVLISLAGASGGALSGIVAANSSYAALSLGGGFLSLLLIPVIIWSRSKRKSELSENMPM